MLELILLIFMLFIFIAPVVVLFAGDIADAIVKIIKAWRRVDSEAELSRISSGEKTNEKDQS